MRASRRELLQVGGIGMLGLTLPQLLQSQSLVAAAGRKKHPTFGKARSCLIVFLSGGASHHDTFDMKPESSAEIRGEFNPISSNVPGIDVCEHLPLLAQQADKYMVVRSVTHRDNNHPSAVYWMETGHEYPRASNLSEYLSREDHPHIGSSLAAVEGTNDKAVPAFITVPDYIAVNGPVRAGQHAGFLGGRFDPLVTGGNPDSPDFKLIDLGLVPSVERERLDQRRRLLKAISGGPAQIGMSAPGRILDGYYEKAFDVLSTGITQRAFDIHTEPAEVRERYGRNLFGQSVLLGRRLVEAGVRLVHVNWIRILEQGWDTHNDNFNSLRNKLLPPMDRAVSALLSDMTNSGLINETLVIVMGEFGRSPKITPSNAGREHWAPANTILMAGAGLPAACHYGATDKDGAYPVERPITPAQLAATIFHALGVDPQSQVTTTLQRPFQICDGNPVLDLWG